MKPSILFSCICLLLLLAVYACNKPQSSTGLCHVQCAQMSAYLTLSGFDSTETDTMFLKIYDGDSNFVNPTTVKQIDKSASVSFTHHQCYELTIPALARNYRIRGITINTDSMHYQGHRCTSTMCFSRPYGAIVNDTAAPINQQQYGAELILKK